MKNQLLNFLSSILNSGINFAKNDEEVVRIKLTNTLSLISLLFCSLYSFIYWKFNFYTLFYINIVALFIYALIPVISSLNIRFSKLFLFFVLVTNIFLASSFFGFKSQIHLILFPVSLLPFLIVDIKERLLIVGQLSFVFLAMYILYLSDYSLLYNSDLDDSFIKFLDIVNKVLTIAGSVIVIYFFIASGYKNKEKLSSLKLSLENQLKVIFEYSFDAILLIEKKTGKIIQANQKAYEYFELKKHNSLFEFAKTHLVDDDLTISEFLHINQKLDANGVWNAEAKFNSIKNEVFWGSISIKKIFIDGEYAQLVRITDITDKKEIEIKLKESEEKYLGIFNATPDGVFLVGKNKNDYYIEDNNPIHKDFVRPYFGDVKGKLLKDVLPPGLLEFPLSKYNECFLSGNSIKYEEYVELPNGEKMSFYTILTPIKDSNGDIRYVLGSARDITSFKKAEENLRNALKEKEVLLSEIHHRVKNNLAIVSGLLMLQAEKVKSPEDYMLFEESRNRIQAMALIHEKLYKNKDLSSVNFSSYLEDLINTISNTYRLGNHVNLNLVANDITLGINNALPLGLLINEIITNSFKHAFVDHPNPRLDVIIAKKERFIQVTIKDNGPGFDFTSALKNSQSLGMTIIDSLINQIDADVSLNNSNGMEYVITFKTNI